MVRGEILRLPSPRQTRGREQRGADRRSAPPQRRARPRRARARVPARARGSRGRAPEHAPGARPRARVGRPTRLRTPRAPLEPRPPRHRLSTLRPVGADERELPRGRRAARGRAGARQPGGGPAARRGQRVGALPPRPPGEPRRRRRAPARPARAGYQARVEEDQLEHASCPCPTIAPGRHELMCQLAEGVVEGVLTTAGGDCTASGFHQDPQRRCCGARLAAAK
jgi:hypothetical protein